jgi:hypothetical protein
MRRDGTVEAAVEIMSAHHPLSLQRVCGCVIWRVGHMGVHAVCSPVSLKGRLVYVSRVTTLQAWQNVINRTMRDALAKSGTEHFTMAHICCVLCDALKEAEPQLTRHAVAVVGWHPQNAEALEIIHATEASELQRPRCVVLEGIGGSKCLAVRAHRWVQVSRRACAGAHIASRACRMSLVPLPLYLCGLRRTYAELRKIQEEKSLEPVWRAMRSGDAELGNPFGLDEDSEDGRSYMPLKSVGGVPMAVLVNGPPSVPDELLGLLSAQAGPLLECVWRRESAVNAVKNVMDFIADATRLNEQSVTMAHTVHAASDAFVHSSHCGVCTVCAPCSQVRHAGVRRGPAGQAAAGLHRLEGVASAAPIGADI